MRITVRLHAQLRKYLPAGASDEGALLDVPDGSTVAGVIERLGIPPTHARMLLSDDESLETTSVLKDGQVVDIFPPLAGGVG